MIRPRGTGRILSGVVVSDKASKTITVEVVRRFRHPKYGKMIRRKSRVHAHDETEEANLGDTVQIVECRPMSRTKRWRLVKVIERSQFKPEEAEMALGVEGAKAL